MGGHGLAFALRKEDNLWTVISVDEIGELGDGSLTLDLILDPVSDPADELAVRAEVDFSESGIIDQYYRAAAHTNFDILTTEQE